jgi:predicted dithiol-disulfide oxidoreductase (DUF899 family)
MTVPDVVSPAEWRSANEALIAKEKELTRARDALAAERRRQPAVDIGGEHEFDGPSGRERLTDLFDGRSQLIVYHFMFPVDGAPCGGCSMFTDQIGHLAHLHARDTSLVLTSRAPQSAIQPFRQRMGWTVPWYSTVGESFNDACGIGTGFGLSVMLHDRDNGRVVRTYFTSSRGVEALGSVWTFLDLTPHGRQETWEDSPAGTPQTPPYQWWDLHDQYEALEPAHTG